MIVVRSLIAGAAFCLCAAGPAAALGADLVFAQNFLTGSKQIVSYPVGDPSNMTVIGPLTDTLRGMDFAPGADVLWAINLATHTLGTVNQATGAYAQAVVIANLNYSAFTIDPVSGTFYVSKDDRFVYDLNPSSGGTNLLGVGAPVGMTIAALAADCRGRLFAVAVAASDTNVNALYEAHVGVSDPTLVGSLGYSGATSLEFDNHTGLLYAWFNPSGTTSTHGTINPTTAEISQTSMRDGKYRMAIRNECSIFADDFEA